MLLAQVTGTVTATAKDAQLVGHKLLLCDLIDGTGSKLGSQLVAVDTVGAGVGDQVMIATGSAARMPSQTTGGPVDAAVIAVVDRISLTKKS